MILETKKYSTETLSQAARQGLAVLMASAVVVLKHQTSTLQSIWHGVGDYVREVTSPAKFGSDPMSGRDATWGPATFVFS